jgi:hypothetical protein
LNTGSISIVIRMKQAYLIGGVEWRTQGSQLIHNAANRPVHAKPSHYLSYKQRKYCIPDIGSFVVLLSVDELWGHVEGGSHVSLGQTTAAAQLLGQPEVPDLQVFVLIEHDIGGFKISM